MKRLTAALAATLTLAATPACALQQAMPASDQPSSAPRTEDVRAALASIPVRPEGPMTGYDRDEFDIWADHDNECDTRAVVLKQTSTTPPEANEHCTVKHGTWRSTYTGNVVTDASGLDVDHLIPLAEAWRSGAADWPQGLRERFGNDLRHGNLAVADAATNRSKGDQDPAGWLPPHDPCAYVIRYIQVTAAWNEQAAATDHELSIDHAEKQALERELNRCE